MGWKCGGLPVDIKRNGRGRGRAYIVERRAASRRRVTAEHPVHVFAAAATTFASAFPRSVRWLLTSDQIPSTAPAAAHKDYLHGKTLCTPSVPTHI